tara:strand:- start:5765 stop:7537 length:1773 start_codon:yes stop_codon:yes gene_type:complete
VPLNKPSDFFEQKKNEERLKIENAKVESKKRILSPSDLLDQKEEIVIEENVEEEVLEEEIIEEEDYILEVKKLIEEVRSQIPEIPEVKDYDNQLQGLEIQINSIWSSITQNPKPKYYDEEIKTLDEKISSIEIPEVKYYDQEIVELSEKINDIKIPEIPEVKYYDEEIKSLDEKISSIEIPDIPEIPEVKYYDEEIKSLDEKIDNIKIPEIPEVKYYDQQIEDLSEKIDGIEIPEVKYYDKEIKSLDEKISSIEIPQVKYYDEEIKILDEKIDNIEIPEIPEVKYYDEEIRVLSERVDGIKIPEVPEIPEVKYYDEDIKELHKLIQEIKEKQEIASLSEGLLDDEKEEKNFATLDDLSNHYRLFVNRIQQQLSTLGGGGETRLEFLDDVDRTSAKVDGKFLKYDSSIGKFIGADGGGASGQGLSTTGFSTGFGLHINPTGTAVTFAEDLVVVGNARVTGILSIGTSSIVLDPNAKSIGGITEIKIESSDSSLAPIILKQAPKGDPEEGKIKFIKTEKDENGNDVETDEEVSVGIGTTVSINTTGIITAFAFFGDGSNLTGVTGSQGVQGTQGSSNGPQGTSMYGIHIMFF